MKNLPNDPIILLSVINTKLRDFYPSLEALCNDMDENMEEIITSLSNVGFEYDSSSNQFR